MNLQDHIARTDRINALIGKRLEVALREPPSAEPPRDNVAFWAAPVGLLAGAAVFALALVIGKLLV